MSTPTIEQRFEALLADTRAQMPDEESAEQIVSAYRKHWSEPPLEPLELVLQRTTNLSDARLLLFFPEPVDMVRYVQLITGGPKGSPDHHPQNRLQRPFLALLYMRHVRAWPLMREFVNEGGLLELAKLFEAENVYLRAQAIDTFMQITSTELHDWFAQPTLEPTVHRRFVELSNPEINFVRAIEANFSDGKGSFPGSSFYCLQILAFWLSLLRYFYCEKRVLRLGTSLMSLLRRWAQTDGLSQEEHDLAVKLSEDFGRFPPVENLSSQFIGVAGPGDAPLPTGPIPSFGEGEAELVQMGRPGEESRISEGADGSESHAAAGAQGAHDAAVAAGGNAPTAALPAAPAATPESTAPTPTAGPPKPPPPAAAQKASAAQQLSAGQQPVVLTDKKGAEALKEEGNQALKRGASEEAVRCYTAALDLCLPSGRHLLLSNRSQAYLKLASAVPQPTTAVPPAAAEWARKAEADARETTRLQPDFVKGYFRLGHAHTVLNAHGKAVEAYEAGLRVAPYNDELRAALRAAREAMERGRRATLKASKEEAAKEEAAKGEAPLAALGGVDGDGGGGAPTPKAPPKKTAVDYDKALATAARAAELVEQRKREGGSDGSAAAGTGGTAVAERTVTDGGATASVPKSYQQFEREWAALKGADAAAQRTYLEGLPVGAYAPLFKESLTEATLATVVGCVHAALLPQGKDAPPDGTAADFTVGVLEGLASTRRFGMLLMFLDAAPSASIRRVFKALAALGRPANAALARAWDVKL